MTSHQQAEDILAEFDIRIVPANVVPTVGETRAVVTVQRIINRYGFDHARFVIMTLADCANNKAALDETVSWATIDIVLAFKKNFPSMMNNDLDRFFEFLNGIAVGLLQHCCGGLDGITNKRSTLLGLIWERTCRLFGDPQGQLFDGRMRA